MEWTPEKLKAHLKENKITQNQAAKIAGVGERTMRRYLSIKERSCAPRHVVDALINHINQNKENDQCQ